MLFADHELQQNISYTRVNETTFSMEFNNLLPYYAYSVSVAPFTVKGIGPASQKVKLTGEEGKSMMRNSTPIGLHFKIKCKAVTSAAVLTLEIGNVVAFATRGAIFSV